MYQQIYCQVMRWYHQPNYSAILCTLVTISSLKTSILQKIFYSQKHSPVTFFALKLIFFHFTRRKLHLSEERKNLKKIFFFKSDIRCASKTRFSPKRFRSLVHIYKNTNLHKRLQFLVTSEIECR